MGLYQFVFFWWFGLVIWFVNIFWVYFGWFSGSNSQITNPNDHTPYSRIVYDGLYGYLGWLFGILTPQITKHTPNKGLKHPNNQPKSPNNCKLSLGLWSFGLFGMLTRKYNSSQTVVPKFRMTNPSNPTTAKTTNNYSFQTIFVNILNRKNKGATKLEATPDSSPKQLQNCKNDQETVK